MLRYLYSAQSSGDKATHRYLNNSCFCCTHCCKFQVLPIKFLLVNNCFVAFLTILIVVYFLFGFSYVVIFSFHSLIWVVNNIKHLDSLQFPSQISLALKSPELFSWLHCEPNYSTLHITSNSFHLICPFPRWYGWQLSNIFKEVITLWQFIISSLISHCDDLR